MSRRFPTVSLHPSDLCFEQFDACSQFVLRIAVEAFAGQETRGIATSYGQVFIHCIATLAALRFVSTPCIDGAGRVMGLQQEP